MKRRGGQAGRILSAAFHQAGNLLLVLLSLIIFGICLLGLRLSYGPLEIPHLASVLATSVSGQGVNVKIQQAELAWAGYRQGGGVPLYLRLGGIAVRNKEKRQLIEIPDARLLVVPSALFGGHAPILVNADHAEFAGSDVTVAFQAAIRLGAAFHLSHARVQVMLGAGRLGAGPMSAPINSGYFTVQVTPHTALLADGVLILKPMGKSAPRIDFSASAQLGTRWQGSATLKADAVAAADLPAYWPAGLAPQTRRWVTQNIIAGTANNGVFHFGLAAPRDLAALRVTSASGHFEGQDLTLIWLRHAMPITALNGEMVILDRNDALVTASSARLGKLALNAGKLKIVGLNVKDQTGYLSLGLDGTVEDTLAILNADPINLLSKAPPGLATAKGDVAGTVSATIPFKKNLPFTDVDLSVAANLTHVALASPVAGLNFTQGAGRVDATGQGIKLAAHAMFAGEPATITLKQGFNDNTQNVTLASEAGPVLFHLLGLDEAVTLNGTAPYTVTISGNPDAAQNFIAAANLAPASFSLPGFGWAKPVGKEGRLDIHGQLNHGALADFASISASTPGLDIQSRLTGKKVMFSILDIGGTRAAGEVDLSEVWSASFYGPVLDMRVDTTPNAKPTSNAPPSGAAWRLHLAFARLRLAPGPAPELTGFSLAASGRGDTPLQLHATASGVVLSVAPLNPMRRALVLQANDAGAFLKATGNYGGMQGGTLALNATYGGEEATTGTANLQKFRILQAPAFTKILQGLTLYGVAQAASGPGLLFSHAVIPFSIKNQTLSLKNARAYSASLGFTATGTVALGNDEANLDATIVPAYAFNALPGKIPLLGRLFTAEKGGGLFAIRAKITGKLSDPKVAPNPLSALTPGVLRGVFGLHKSNPK